MTGRVSARLLFVAALALLLVPSTARADAVLRIQYSALQRMLAEQVFTTEGRRYVKGSKDSRCSYAYLEHPRVDAEAEGRLRIRARFSGRSGLDVFGHCMGFGDDFDLAVVVTPYYKDGAIRFRDVQIETSARGLYAGRVCAALAESLPAQFAYPALQQARRALESRSPATDYPRELRRFEVTRVAVTRDSLVLTLDFEVAIGG